MHDDAQREGIEKVAELVKDIRTAMLVTLDEHGHLRSRPMGTSDAPFDGTIWFFTPAASSSVIVAPGPPCHHRCGSRRSAAIAARTASCALSIGGTPTTMFTKSLTARGLLTTPASIAGVQRIERWNRTKL